MVAENSSVCRSLRQLGDDLADVVDEAHVEHAVGFVEHQHLDAAQVDVALVHQVEQPAGRGDEDVDAAAQRVDLRVLPDAAEDDGAGAGSGAARRCGSCRRSASPARGWGRGRGTAPCGLEPAAGGLATRRCRIGSANAAVLPVPVWAQPSTSRPVEDVGDGLRLDGRGGGVTFGGDGAQDGLGEPQIGKLHRTVLQMVQRVDECAPKRPRRTPKKGRSDALQLGS